jgi:hypothetical protein
LRKLVRVSAVAALMAAVIAVMAAPAMADDLFDNNDDEDVFVVFGDDDDNCDFNNLFGFFGNNACDFSDFNDFNDFNGTFDNNGDFFGNEVEQESESGDVSLGFDVSNTGRYASQCTPATQFGNTGNFQNGTSFVQGPGSELDDFEPEGIEVSFGGSQEVSCPSTIEQSSAASS